MGPMPTEIPYRYSGPARRAVPPPTPADARQRLNDNVAAGKRRGPQAT